ncbi:MAG TPA: NAD(P)H-dependent oxidoreductase [Tenericutes bacterium]|nr:NAD(P)H-dependent oxidoreductase [Mycoplasmatota bacterium]
MKKIKIVGITGSLRQASYNKASLLAIKKLFENKIDFEILNLEAIPFFNEEMESGNIPDSVVDMNNKFKEADGIIIATPEYNFSYAPALKNALDWASRNNDYPLSGKPTAIYSCSMSLLGGVRAQYHLRQVAVALNMDVINKPEVCVMSCHKKFDGNLNLIDEQTIEMLKKLVETLIQKIEG